MNAFFFSRISCRQRAVFGAGLFSLMACAIGGWFNSRQFFISYLFAYLFWIGLSLGCLCLAMIHHLTGGKWGDVTRRFLEAGYMTFPMMALLFIPVVGGLRYFHPGESAATGVGMRGLFHAIASSSVSGSTIRAFIYFWVWAKLGGWLRKWSLQQDATYDLAPTRHARWLSGPGIVIYGLTVSCAWCDWVVSLEPASYTVLLPFIICGGQVLAACAFAILILDYFRREQPFKDVIDASHFRQLGRLLLTSVIIWAYVCFCQLFLTWRAGLYGETGWNFRHMTGGWSGFALVLAFLNFLLPFLLLIFRNPWRGLRALRIIAASIFVCQLLNMYWLIEPSVFPVGIHLHWMDFAAALGIGGLWLARFAVSFKRAPLIAQTDSRCIASFAHA